MAEPRRPILRALTQIQRYRAESFFASADRQKILVEPRLAMVVQQTSGPHRTVPTDQQMPTKSVAHQCPYPRPVDRYVDWVKPADDFISDLTRLFFILNSRVAAKLPMPCEPRQEQYGDDRTCKFKQFGGHAARPRSISIIAVIGVRSYPASAAFSAKTAG